MACARCGREELGGWVSWFLDSAVIRALFFFTLDRHSDLVRFKVG